MIAEITVESATLLGVVHVLQNSLFTVLSGQGNAEKSVNWNVEAP